MSSSDLSSLSSPPSTDTEEEFGSTVGEGSRDNYLKNGADNKTDTSGRPSGQRKRPASPPHEYVLADNPDIAFIVMFRSRFNDVFPKSLPQYGPQDIENGVVESVPGAQVERLLCALLGLVLNRKKDVERGHHQRALEEAVHAHENQWPSSWNLANPLHGGKSFNTMSGAERLILLKALILWSLHSSEAVLAVIKESYKQQRHDDDLNQPLSVQPWGRDGDKRRYWLIEGQDDTHFRLYRESNPVLKHNTWRSVAGTIDELKEVAEKLGEEGSQAARRLKERIMLAIPRFEASEEKRKRRDYRNARKAQFVRPEPGFSLYEGRTRGKRMRYTFSDEDEDGSDATSTRRSTRNSGINTPAEPSGPTFTASGRQVKARVRGAYGETLLSTQITSRPSVTDGGLEIGNNGQEQPNANDRLRRSGLRKEVDGWTKPGHHIPGYNSVDEMGSESSEGEWDGGDDDDEVDEPAIDADEADDEDMSEGDTDTDDVGVAYESGRSLVVQLRYHKKGELKTNGHIEMVKSPEKCSPQLTAPWKHEQEAIPNGQSILPMVNSGPDTMRASPPIHDAIQVLPPPLPQDRACRPAQ